MTGSGGNDIFAFFAASTSGKSYVVTDFNASDSVYLVGYSQDRSTTLLQNSAVVDATGVTFTLSDQTKITFSNLTSVTPLNGHISMG